MTISHLLEYIHPHRWSATVGVVYLMDRSQLQRRPASASSGAPVTRLPPATRHTGPTFSGPPSHTTRGPPTDPPPSQLRPPPHQFHTRTAAPLVQAFAHAHGASAEKLTSESEHLRRRDYAEGRLPADGFQQMEGYARQLEASNRQLDATCNTLQARNRELESSNFTLQDRTRELEMNLQERNRELEMRRLNVESQPMGDEHLKERAALLRDLDAKQVCHPFVCQHLLMNLSAISL